MRRSIRWSLLGSYAVTLLLVLGLLGGTLYRQRRTSAHDALQGELLAHAQAIAGAIGFTGNFRFDATKPNGQPRRALDCSRAEELFGFRASTSLRDGLARTVEWYREHRRRESPHPALTGASAADTP